MAEVKEEEKVKSVQKSEVYDFATTNNSKGEVKVKLKIREKEEAKPMEAEDERIGVKLLVDPMKKCVRNDVERVCHVCSKVFSSGKALGGHMRIHMIHPSNKKDSTVSSRRKPPSFCPLIKNPICTICGKNFPSMKSLFGHMRCHPERGWRGINPPTASSSSSSLSDPSEIKDDQLGAVAGKNGGAVNLEACLKRTWPVTGKRGRKAIGGSSSSVHSSSDEDQAQLLEAVKFLMMLARGDRGFVESVGRNGFCNEGKKPVIDGSLLLNESVNNNDDKQHTYSSYDQDNGQLDNDFMSMMRKKKRKKSCLGSLLDQAEAEAPVRKVMDFDLNEMPESSDEGDIKEARVWF